jgi:large subunit ribosomal protein L21
VERLDGTVGDQVIFDQVLAVEDAEALEVGTPFLDGARVVGTIVEQGKSGKITVLKFKRRKMYRKRRGHRQLFTSVKIESIVPRSASEPSPAEEKAEQEEPQKKEAKETAGSRPARRKAGSAAKTAKKAPSKKTEGQATAKKTKARSQKQKNQE